MSGRNRGYKLLWALAWIASDDLRFTEAIAALRIIAKHDPNGGRAARDAISVLVSRRNAYRNDHRPMLEYWPPDRLEKVWSWTELEDPLDNIIFPGDSALMAYYEEWSREIEEGREARLEDRVSRKLERKLLAKDFGWGYD